LFCTQKSKKNVHIVHTTKRRGGILLKKHEKEELKGTNGCEQKMFTQISKVYTCEQKVFTFQKSVHTDFKSVHIVHIVHISKNEN